MPHAMRPPTPRQLEILGYMRRFLAEYHVPPTIREMCEAFDMSSPNAMMGHLRSMLKKGLVVQTEVGRHRSYLPKGGTR